MRGCPMHSHTKLAIDESNEKYYCPQCEAMAQQEIENDKELNINIGEDIKIDEQIG